jgi:radical SAM superfamily enzyme YgiQ (UPF0313 family)
MPKLLLITASSLEIQYIRKTRVLNFQQITMPYLAARVPSHWHISHIDESVEPIDWHTDADLVGITFHTPSAIHSYGLADRFRNMGKCVVLGGPHVTLLPDEARLHADVIFIGEAEGLWEEFLIDFEAGKYKNSYKRSAPAPLENLLMASKLHFHRRDHSDGVLFATRSCPNRCDFCCIPVMYGQGIRKRPIDQVAAEYGSFKGKIIIFWDENIAGDMEYAKALFRAITPYKKWWSCQAGIQAGKSDEFLEAAATSGCKQLFIGLESICQSSMDEAHKNFNKVEEYAQVIHRIHQHGIAVQAGIVFGFDHDTRGVFKDTIDFLEETGVQNATFNILTPFPGTPLFKRLELEKRITTHDWQKYNGRQDVVFQPAKMSAEDLLEGFHYANSRFYAPAGIRRRLSRSPVQLWWTLPLSLAYMFRWKQSK